MRTLIFCIALTVCAALGVSICPQQATAQEPPAKVSAKDLREAKRLFNQGHLAYRRGDYEEAILKWQESYGLSKEPLINESIANAYERLGKPGEALEHLSRWREAAPRREHKELDSRIESLESRLKRQNAEEAKKREEEERRKREDEERRAELEQQSDAKQDGADTSEPDDDKQLMDIVGFSMVGVGGVAVIVGVVLDIVAATTRPDESEACDDTSGSLLCREGSKPDIERSNKLAIAGDITWIAGAAIAAGGAAVLLFFSSYAVIGSDDGGDTKGEQGDGEEAEREAFVVPYGDPAGGGVVIQGTF